MEHFVLRNGARAELQLLPFKLIKHNVLFWFLSVFLFKQISKLLRRKRRRKRKAKRYCSIPEICHVAHLPRTEVAFRAVLPSVLTSCSSDLCLLGSAHH